MNTIDRINKITSYNELQILAEQLLTDIDLDDSILEAIIDRQDALHIPTKKDNAELAWRTGLTKKATPRQAKINRRLKIAYENA